ncbi:MAG: ATP synthase F1 subunit delta [Elusimicrobia bacterium RIFOXYA2_FULL_39_19]|nr:MAG: ATP synthase F1 subunit delta [Elusimicrobia bacterium RIFOXYA2_FULL_39_19]
MRNYFISKKYAKAFYPSIENNFDASIALLRKVHAYIFTTAQISDVFNHPFIDVKEKTALLSDFLKNNINKNAIQCLEMLIEKRRIELLGEITDELSSIHAGKTNTENVMVETAFDLTAEEKNNLEGKIAGYLNKKVITEFIVNKKLIAGLTIKYSGNIIDNSVSSQIKDLKETMLSSAI